MEIQRRKQYVKTCSPMLVIFLCFFALSCFQPTHCKTILVDGFSERKMTNAHVGDSIIFTHKYPYKLYIFRTRKAFNLCNFTQAYPLIKPNSTSFTWNTSRPGFFYFSFMKNVSPKPCQQGRKLAIKVSPATSHDNVAPVHSIPVEAPAPASSGRALGPSPAHPWPPGPRGKEWQSASPPEDIISGGALPFINSNPADPLPTGEVDSATIRPVPTSGSGPLVARFLAVQTLLCPVVFLLV